MPDVFTVFLNKDDDDDDDDDDAQVKVKVNPSPPAPPPLNPGKAGIPILDSRNCPGTRGDRSWMRIASSVSEPGNFSAGGLELLQRDWDQLRRQPKRRRET